MGQRYSSRQSVTPGTIIAFTAATIPDGWLLCDGSQLTRTTYAALYAVIVDAFGAGNGTTTFNLPDLRGRFLRGVDGVAGRDPDAAGRTAMNSGGNVANNPGSIQAHSSDGHSHGFRYAATQATGRSNPLNPTFFPYFTNIAITGATNNIQAFIGSTALTPLINLNAGIITATGNTENRAANAYVNFLIKY